MSTELRWTPSRFNVWTNLSDEEMVIYNSLTGAFMQFKGPAALKIIKLMEGKLKSCPKGLITVLAQRGFLVPETTNEIDRLNRLVNSILDEKKSLELILMPTEECNFRCVYCYEKYQNGPMSALVTSSISETVKRHLPNLRSLTVSWFGGEPLIAIDRIEEISKELIRLCDENGVAYSANISTNGYLLTNKMAERCFSALITRFQVTLDGVQETHDKTRILRDGTGTFATILLNLKNLHQSNKDFQVKVRVNFNEENLSVMPEFIKALGREFAGDPRFSLYFRAVGQWGDKPLKSMGICNLETAKEQEIQLMTMSLQEGFGLDTWKNSMRLCGSVCYAANPNSYVIGSDGRIYKCTVAFDNPLNQIGKLGQNGALNTNEERLKLWTSSEIDKDCKECAFLPTCFGKTCPLVKISKVGKTCPLFKTHTERFLRLLALEAINPKECERD